MTVVRFHGFELFVFCVYYVSSFLFFSHSSASLGWTDTIWRPFSFSGSEGIVPLDLTSESHGGSPTCMWTQPLGINPSSPCANLQPGTCPQGTYKNKHCFIGLMKTMISPPRRAHTSADLGLPSLSAPDCPHSPPTEPCTFMHLHLLWVFFLQGLVRLTRSKSPAETYMGPMRSVRDDRLLKTYPCACTWTGPLSVGSGCFIPLVFKTGF